MVCKPLPGSTLVRLCPSSKHSSLGPQISLASTEGIHWDRSALTLYLLTSNTTTRFSTDEGAKAQISIPRSRIWCPRYQPALIRPKCRGKACQSLAQFYSTFSWLASSNTTTSLPYISHPCCKQKAGKLSKQNNFLPEDKLLRTSAQILIPIHPISWTELLSSWSQQKSIRRVYSFGSISAFLVHFLTWHLWAQNRTSMRKFWRGGGKDGILRTLSKNPVSRAAGIWRYSFIAENS